MSQIVEKPDGTGEIVPWRFDTEDRRHKTLAERAALTALFGLEGAMFGAGMAAQVAPRRSPVWIGGGTAAGVIVGLGYAGVRRGVEASMEQGDTFEIVVGTTSFQPIPRSSLTTVYPAPNPSQRQGKEKEHP
jgi:hypothetical protein